MLMVNVMFQYEFEQIIMFKTSCKLFTGHIEGRATVNDSEPASITIS